MSYHFYIKNNASFSYAQLLAQPQLPAGTALSYAINPAETVSGQSKYYVPGLSSRGVRLDVSEKNYDIVLNTGATKDDYFLGTRLALALAGLNGSLITPEFDSEQTPQDFETHYNAAWAVENRHMGLGSVLYMINKDPDASAMLSGCVRPYCIGNYVLDRLKADNPDETVLFDRIIEEIRHMQFLEDEMPELYTPSVVTFDFPKEGLMNKEVSVIVSGHTLFLRKVDYVVLNNKALGLARVPHDAFLARVAHMARRVDEHQYIIDPIADSDFDAMLLDFKNATDESASQKNEAKTPVAPAPAPRAWWQFWK